MTELIPAGKYLATAVSSALGHTSKGDPQVAVELDIHRDQQHIGTRTWYGYFTEKSLQTTEKALAALGFDIGERNIGELGPEEPTASPIAGAPCRVVIEHENDEQTGEVRDRVRWINHADSAGPALKERMNPAEAHSFGEQLRARVLAQRGPQQAAAPRQAAPRPPAQAARPSATPAAAPAHNNGRFPLTQGGRPNTPAAPPPRGGGEYDDIPF